MADEVLVLEPGDDRAKKIARAMASQTATDILGVLKHGEHTSSEIAESLSVPITTVAYHIDNLLDSGMIEVARTRWSRKGREVKVYGLADTLVIVSPGIKDIRSILLKYAQIFGIFLIATIMVTVIAAVMMNGMPMGEFTTLSEQSFNKGAADEAALRATPVSAMAGGVPLTDNIQYLLVLIFFLGGSTVLLFLIIWDIVAIRRNR
jgi:DNA-binding transcriptional ArsR family regulator